MSRRSLKLSASAATLLSLSLVTPAPADTLVLRHGGTFENVVVTETGECYRVQMDGGELRLAVSEVARVERSPSSFGETLTRRAALATERSAAAAWLDLARFALDHGLRHSAREAALTAAGLDPGLAGLEPVLRRFGYAQDERSGEWVTHSQQMARRGLVQQDGEWVTPEERRQRWDALRERELSRRRIAVEEARLRRELEDLSRPAAAPTRATAPTVVVLPIVASFPVPFVFLPNPLQAPAPANNPTPETAPAPAPPRPASRVPTLDLLERQPGSLIPGELRLGPP